MKRRFLTFFVVCFLVTFLCISGVSAQGVPSGAGLTLTPSTNNPNPGQNVTITAASYSFDINASTVTWKSGSTVIQSGVGLTRLTVQAPVLGKRITIDVSATNADGNHSVGTIVIGSGAIDMILESSGYVPSVFRGKTPLSYQNTFTVTAIPHISNTSGQEYDPKTLVYTWKKDDGKTFQDQSGFDKQSITIDGAIIARTFVLSVIVSTRDGSAQGEGSVEIDYNAPSITFYVDDPLYGPLWNTAITDTVRIGSQKETSVIAAPYGYDKPYGGVGDLEFTWLINSIKHVELAASNSVILRAPDGTSGSSNIQLNIRNTDRILQGGDAGFSATFSGKDSTAAQTTF